MIISLMKGPTKYDSFLMDTGNYVFLITCYVVTALSAIIIFALGYNFYDVLKSCYEVDKSLEQFRIVINHQKNFMFYVKFAAIDAFIFVILNTISIQKYESSAVQNLVPFGHLSIIYCIYIVLLYVVIVRFESINSCLM